MRFPDGVTAIPYYDNRDNQWKVHVQYSKEYMDSVIIKILDERIARAKVALPLCKHTKRKRRLIKLLSVLEQARVTFEDSELPTHLEGSD